MKLFLKTSKYVTKFIFYSQLVRVCNTKLLKSYYVLRYLHTQKNEIQYMYEGAKKLNEKSKLTFR